MKKTYEKPALVACGVFARKLGEKMCNRVTATIGAAVSASALVSTAALGDLQVTPLLKQEIQGMENMEANIALFEVDPGFETERHIHPGHVFVYVLEGTIEVDAEGEDPIQVSAGEAAYELPNLPMVGRNTSSTEGARFVVFQVGEAGKPLMIDQPK
jgi:quercetin dioxygenase-like cupin family protein